MLLIALINNGYKGWSVPLLRGAQRVLDDIREGVAQYSDLLLECEDPKKEVQHMVKVTRLMLSRPWGIALAQCLRRSNVDMENVAEVSAAAFDLLESGAIDTKPEKHLKFLRDLWKPHKGVVVATSPSCTFDAILAVDTAKAKATADKLKALWVLGLDEPFDLRFANEDWTENISLKEGA